MTEHNKADYDYQTTVAMVLSVASRAKTIFENSSEVAGKRAFLNYLLQNCRLSRKKLSFEVKSPSNYILTNVHQPTVLRIVKDVRTVVRRKKAKLIQRFSLLFGSVKCFKKIKS